jgi:hypothetical protein
MAAQSLPDRSSLPKPYIVSVNLIVMADSPRLAIERCVGLCEFLQESCSVDGYYFESCLPADLAAAAQAVSE